jgi:hypothetical protein
MDKLGQLEKRLREKRPRTVDEVVDVVIELLPVVATAVRRRDAGMKRQARLAATIMNIEKLVLETLGEIRHDKGFRAAQVAVAVEEHARRNAELATPVKPKELKS